MIKLKDAYELIIGSSLDPQFGPVLLFGTGGQLVEVFKDRALALPPLNTTLARRMMEQTKIYKALKGRSRPAAGGSGGARTADGAVQRAGGGAAVDQGDRHQPAAGFAGRADRARCARGGARTGSHAGAGAEDGHSRLSDALRGALDDEGRHAGDDPADSSRGRARDGALPRDAFASAACICGIST